MSVVHVAVAVIVKPATCFYDRQILISKRPDHVHQGGLWEFPGGKVEHSEQIISALARELDEELGIQIDTQSGSLAPLIEIHHDYGDKQVFLDVWLVSDFSGEPHGKEGQLVRWVPSKELQKYDFPAANRPILSACQLPRQYVITPEYFSLKEAQDNLHFMISLGAELILLRQPQLPSDAYLSWAKELLPLCKGNHVKLVASGKPDLLNNLDFDGLQLPWSEAKGLSSRPIPKHLLLGVSCHNQDELVQAELLCADFVTLSPVLQTHSHPDAKPLGWSIFRKLAHNAKLPIFALGGLDQEHLKKAVNAGAQGIAGIRCWQA